MSSRFLTGMGALSFHQFIWVPEVMSGHVTILALVSSLIGDNAASKYPDISHGNDIELHMATTEENPILIGVTRYFVKSTR